MKFSNSKSYIKLAIITLLIILPWVVTGCGDFGQFPTPTPTSEKKMASPPVISTEDRAILAVYEHLLSLAEGYKAKQYLAEFYATCDNWSAKSELLRDGTTIWNVAVNMSSNKTWQWRPYWQQASWFILRDGKVIPSNRFQGNALKIEADLQELNLQPKS